MVNKQHNPLLTSIVWKTLNFSKSYFVFHLKKETDTGFELHLNKCIDKMSFFGG